MVLLVDINDRFLVHQEFIHFMQVKIVLACRKFTVKSLLNQILKGNVALFYLTKKAFLFSSKSLTSILKLMNMLEIGNGGVVEIFYQSRIF